MISLGTPQLRVQIDPERGAALTSLRTGELEWLATGPRCDSVDPDNFLESGLRGYDDCFPSISRTTRGEVSVSDHGFVWSRPWQVMSADSTSVSLQVQVPEYACTLTRRVRVGDGVQLDYSLACGSDVPLPFVWAGHCLFAASVDLDVVMRAPVSRLDSSFGVDPADPWPPDREAYRWDDANVGGYAKWFAPWPRRGVLVRRGSRALQVDARAEESLPLSLGVWVNRDAFPRERPVSHLGLEPTIGDADDLAVAMERGSCGWVSSDAPVRWSVTLTPR